MKMEELTRGICDATEDARALRALVDEGGTLEDFLRRFEELYPDVVALARDLVERPVRDEEKRFIAALSSAGTMMFWRALLRAPFLNRQERDRNLVQLKSILVSKVLRFAESFKE